MPQRMRCPPCPPGPAPEHAPGPLQSEALLSWASAGIGPVAAPAGGEPEGGVQPGVCGRLQRASGAVGVPAGPAAPACETPQ
jgi:hypothetical protein